MVVSVFGSICNNCFYEPQKDGATKICGRCKIEKDISQFGVQKKAPDGHCYYCRSCFHVYHRQWYYSKEGKIFNEKYREKANENHRKAALNEKDKDRARVLVRSALKSGIIIKSPCSVCGNPKAQAHHEDYSKPLGVVWLCSKHHTEKHYGIPQ